MVARGVKENTICRMAVVGSITYLNMGVGADLSSPTAAVKSLCQQGLCTPVAHVNSAFCTPANPPAGVDMVGGQLSTPHAGPLAEPSQLMPLFCETPQPTTLEFRSAVKLKVFPSVKMWLCKH